MRQMRLNFTVQIRGTVKLVGQLTEKEEYVCTWGGTKHAACDLETN